MSEISPPAALAAGSTSGIGAATARRRSADAHAVVLHSRGSAQAGHALARESKSAVYVQADPAVVSRRKVFEKKASMYFK